MRIFTRRRLGFWGAGLRLAAVAGAVFGPVAGAMAIAPRWQGALFGWVSATVDSVLMIGILAGLEIFVPRTRFGRALARQSFAVNVLFKLPIYLLVVGAVIGGRIGPKVALVAANPETAARIFAQLETGLPRGPTMVVAVIIALLVAAVGQASQLVGERTFRSILLGRYHRPLREERFFLFIDIIGSTPVAERLGALEVHRYLNRIIQIAADPIDDHRGDVFQYVGDEVVVTWTAAEGRPEARPLACLFAVEAALAEAASEFQRDFGTIPKLRAALHAGEVVAGEIGGTRRSIVFHGDVMNTTARIENATRDLGRPFLVSEDALQRLEGTDRYTVEDLGVQQLRGRQAGMRVFAVSRPAV